MLKNFKTNQETMDSRRRMFVREGNYVITGIPVKVSYMDNGKIVVKLLYVMQEDRLVFRELDCLFEKGTDVSCITNSQIVLVAGKYIQVESVFYSKSIELCVKYGEDQTYESLEGLLILDKSRRETKRYSDLIISPLNYETKEKLLECEDSELWAMNLEFEEKLDVISSRIYSNIDRNYMKMIIMDAFYFNTCTEYNPHKVTGIFKNKISLSIYNEILDNVINQMRNTKKVYTIQHLILLLQLYTRIKLLSLITKDNDMYNEELSFCIYYAGFTNRWFSIIDSSFDVQSIITKNLL